MPADVPGRLTLHVLDTARGRPAAGLALSLFRLSGNNRELLSAWTTNQDGRCDAPLLAGDALQAGSYEIEFDVGAWRAQQGETEPSFYELIPIRFRITDPAGHYHIPLLLSPFGYVTYRGS